MLLSHIPDEKEANPIKLAHLVGIFSEFFDDERIISELSRLERDRFVCQTPSGSFYKLNGWMPLQRTIVALELKLSRIQDVLRQAITNLEFADKSYVGLPLEVVSRLARSGAISVFMENGVGVVGFDRGTHKVIVTARYMGHRTDHVLQTHCVERFWRQYFKDSST